MLFSMFIVTIIFLGEREESDLSKNIKKMTSILSIGKDDNLQVLYFLFVAFIFINSVY